MSNNYERLFLFFFRCIVSDRRYQKLGPQAFIKEIRKKIDVSIVDSETCQSLQRHSSELNVQSSSFICVRGEDDEDACMVSLYKINNVNK